MMMQNIVLFLGQKFHGYKSTYIQHILSLIKIFWAIMLIHHAWIRKTYVLQLSSFKLLNKISLIPVLKRPVQQSSIKHKAANIKSIEFINEDKKKKIKAKGTKKRQRTIAFVKVKCAKREVIDKLKTPPLRNIFAVPNPYIQTKKLRMRVDWKYLY